MQYRVTASDIQRGYSNIRDKIKEEKIVVVTRHNKDDLVFLDINYYMNLLEIKSTLEEKVGI